MDSKNNSYETGVQVSGGESSRSPKKIESLLAKILLTLTSILVGIIAIELIARFYLWNIAPEADFRILASMNQIKDYYGDDVYIQEIDRRALSWSPHHFLGHYPTPNYRHGKNMHNALGFRGDEFAVDKPASTYRIVAIGGSTTYSIDVQDYQKSYPNLLEEYLHERGFDHVEVINAGVIAYTSHQNLMNLQFRVLPLQPDMIIVYQGFNDIPERFVYPYSRYLGDSSGSVEPIVPDVFMPDIAEYSTALRILGIRAGLTRSHAALEWHFSRRPRGYPDREFARQTNAGIYPSGIFDEISIATLLENNPPVHFERNLVNMVAAASSHNVELVLVTMALDEDYHETRGGGTNLKFTSQEYISGLRQHNDLTRRIAAQTSTSLMDLADQFPDDYTLFTDGLHMNENGNRKRAQIIGDFVIRTLSMKLVQQ